MSSDDTTTAAPGTGPKVVPLIQPTNEVVAAGDHIRRNMDALIDNQRTIARIRRAAYLAYVAEGFTEVQAMELCTK